MSDLHRSARASRRLAALRPLAAAAALAVPAIAAAQDAATASDPVALDQVVVVGAMTDVVLEREDIELAQAGDLADLFRAIPSVQVGGGVGLAQKIYVRGLEDSLLNVTVDGAPQRGTLFHHVGRVSIEPELLEVVELQAGPGEATSGFGAIGGAIRFRTRNPVDLLQPGRDAGALLKAGWFDNDGHKASATAFGRLSGDIGILASAVRVDRDDYADGDGTTLRGTGADQRLGFLKIGGDLANGHRFAASYEVRREEGEFGARPNWPVLADEPLFPVEGERRTGVLNYGMALGDGAELEATGYRTESSFVQDRFDRWGRYGAEIETWGFDLRGRFTTGTHRVTAGVEHRDDTVSSQYLADAATWQPWAWDPAVGRFEEQGRLLGVYVQDQWQVGEPLLLSYGARYDRYDLDLVTYGGGTDSDGVSVNAGASWRLAPGLTLNAGYAEAFRGKEIGDAFTLEQRPGRLTLSPTLRPETVDNVELGLAWAQDGLSASAVVYRMTIDDVVLDQLYGGPPPQGGVYYENVGTFRSEGVELRAGVVRGVFSADAWYNHYDSRLNGRRIEGYEHIALGNSMGDSWHLTLGYRPTDALDLQLGVNHVQDLDDVEVLFRDVELGYLPATRFVDKPGYTVVDVFARWRPTASERFELFAGVYNLFDRTYRAHASVADYTAIPDYELVAGLNEPGRNVRLGASLRF